MPFGSSASLARVFQCSVCLGNSYRQIVFPESAPWPQLTPLQTLPRTPLPQKETCPFFRGAFPPLIPPLRPLQALSQRRKSCTSRRRAHLALQARSRPAPKAPRKRSHGRTAPNPRNQHPTFEARSHQRVSESQAPSPVFCGLFFLFLRGVSKMNKHKQGLLNKSASKPQTSANVCTKHRPQLKECGYSGTIPVRVNQTETIHSRG